MAKDLTCMAYSSLVPWLGIPFHARQNYNSVLAIVYTSNCLYLTSCIVSISYASANAGNGLCCLYVQISSDQNLKLHNNTASINQLIETGFFLSLSLWQLAGEFLHQVLRKHVNGYRTVTWN